MKKLLYILLFIPFLAFGQQGGPTINQIQPNFRTGGIWKPMGTVMYGDLAGETGLEEPSVLYEGNPQLLTGTTGSVFKMMFTQEVGSAQNVMYAESLDGITWYRSSTVCISNHARGFLFKDPVSGHYYYYCVNATTFKSLDIYTSTTAAPGSWTLVTTGALTSAGAGGMIANSIANMVVVYDGTNYQMLLSGNSIGGNVFVTGLWTSSSPTGTSWTAYGSNPVLGNLSSPYLEIAPGSITKVGSTWYLFGYQAPSGTSPNLLPTDIYRYHSSNLTSWTTDNSGNSTYPRTQADEGVATSTGQVANTAVIEANGKTYMFYSAVGDGNGIANGIHIKCAIANMTMANLILTNEGNGNGLNEAIPSVYTQTQTDYKYIPNATNVGNNSTWTQGSILMTLDNPNQYGWRLRDYTTNTNQTIILPDIIYLNRSGVTNSISGSSSSLDLTGFGAINFKNSGSGASTLGSFDNTGLLSTTAGFQANGGNGFLFMSPAFGATNTQGASIRNQTAATSGVPVRWSPSWLQIGAAWTGSASQLVQFNQILKPISGTNPVTYNYEWVHNINLAGDVTRLRLNSNGQLTLFGVLQLTSYTVSTLPTGSVGMEAYVTDASSPSMGSTVAGGGTSNAKVWYNGTNWTVTGL